MAKQKPKQGDDKQAAKKNPGQANQAHKKAAFLKAYEKTGGKSLAAKAVGISRGIVWEWEKADEEFREAVLAVEEADTEELEGIAAERARAKSDLLMMFLLNGRKPEKYKQRTQTEHSGEVTVKLVRFGSKDAKDKP